MLHNKVLTVLIFAFLFSFTANGQKAPVISAESAVIINAQTNESFYEKNANAKRSMASTTKIMTSLLAVESGKLDDEITAHNFSAEGTSIGLKDGYILTLESLVYGMLLESGNDAARLTANYLAGNEENFSLLMNKKAAEIGMRNTNFVTASGLDDDNHYSTAYDMALLGSYAVKNPDFRAICSLQKKTVTYVKPEISVTFSNHNRLLYSCEGVFGIKTGFTRKSGRCLVSACNRNGKTFIAVTLNAPDDWNDHKKLYDYAFNEVKTETVTVNYNKTVKIYGGINNYINIQAEPFEFDVLNKDSVSKKVLISKILYAPIKKGEIIGKILYYYNGSTIYSADIISLDNVDAIDIRLSLFERIKERIKSIILN